MKAAIYARLSDSRKSGDITTQVNILTAYCEKLEWPYETYIEEGSARHGKKRPIFDQLMLDAHQRKIDVVVVWKLDRLSRSTQEFAAAVRELDRCGVRFISYTQGIDTDQSSITGKLMMNVLAAFAEFESDMISERVSAGMARAREKGKEIGRPKRIFDIEKVLELRREGMSVAKIAEELEVGKRTIERRLSVYEETHKDKDKQETP